MQTRDRLLQGCLTYFLRHGVANLSLRPLAADLGTSARMLLHYFGSKEALIAEVMERVQARLQNAFQVLNDSQNRRAGYDLLLSFWRILSNKHNQPFLRLLFEVQMLALQDPRRYRRDPRGAFKTWQRVVVRTLPAKAKSV